MSKVKTIIDILKTVAIVLALSGILYIYSQLI